MSKLSYYLFLSIVSWILFLPGMAHLPVVDRDEAHFVQATRQMMQTGHYGQIRFQDITRFQKPPGINWLQVLPVRWFSDADSHQIWPYRIPSALSAWLAVLLTFGFFAKIVGERAAFFGALILAATLLLGVEAHMAVIDASLLAAVVLMQGALWRIYDASQQEKPSHWGWALLFWLAMTYGFLLKGVTPLVGVLTVMALCTADRRISWLKRLRIIPGLLLFLALNIAWLVLVSVAEHSNYLMQMIHRDLLPKLQGGHESHGKPPLFHLIILPMTFWPGSLFLWQAGVYGITERAQPVIRFLLAWIIPTWCFFELMPTKLPQYVLPTFPALALLCGLAIEQLFGKPGRILHFLQAIWVVLSLGLAVFIAVLPYLVLGKITWLASMTAMILAVLSCCGGYFAWREQYRKACAALIGAALVSYPLIFSGVLPSLKPVWISQSVRAATMEYPITDASPLLSVGFSEPSLVFYFNTRQIMMTDKDTAINQLKQHPTQWMLIDITAFSAELSNPDWLIAARINGYNYSNGKWVTLLLVRYNRPGGMST